MHLVLVFVAAFLISSALLARDAHHEHSSDYSGQQHRDIKSLSPEDIAELKAGSGWGLAKAAELNGLPGPRHLLDMRDELDLTNSQIQALEQIYTKMNRAAIELGEKLITQERNLEARFRGKLPNREELAVLLNDIGSTHSELRYIHLSAHLETPDILNAAQVKRYNRLRGYATSDPCDSVPQGHNAAMWKKHNNCN